MCKNNAHDETGPTYSSYADYNLRYGELLSNV